MKIYITLLLMLIFAGSLRAEGLGLYDSVTLTDCCAEGALVADADSIEVDSPSKFKLRKLISPASPIFLGSLTLYVSHADNLDIQISDYISNRYGTMHFDDYLQYSPVVIMWSLDAFASIEPRHKFKQQTTIVALSALTSLVLVQGTKHFVDRRRPDSGARNSFPSGHTATAFLGAEILHQEYGHHSVWISVAGYSIAALTGYMRVFNERHYAGDVIAGAGFGMLSARIAYWATPRLNEWLWGSATGYEDHSSLRASLAPCSLGDNLGVSLSVTF